MLFRCAIFLLAILPLSASTRAGAENSLARARQSVAAAPADGASHVQLAIALGKLTDFVDNGTKMKLAREIRSEAETGLRLDPKNDLACRILAKWHDGMSSLNPLLRGIAAALYGKMPEASAAEAEAYFRRAIVLAPEKIPHRAELAAFLERHGRRAEALAEWRTVVTLSPADAEDRAFLQTAGERLADR